MQKVQHAYKKNTHYIVSLKKIIFRYLNVHINIWLFVSAVDLFIPLSSTDKKQLHAPCFTPLLKPQGKNYLKPNWQFE